MKKQKKIISDTILNQKKLLEFFIIVIILAIGLNLISDQVPIFLKIDSLTTIFLGVALGSFSIIYFSRQILNNRKQIRNYQAFFIYDGKKNAIKKIPHYKFSDDMVHIMNAAFIENINLKKFWDTEPLKKSFPSQMGKKSTIKTNSINFINELTEYLILERLSTHLTDHFNRKEIPKNELKTYERSDIPEVLLKNRFLEIISHPISERPIFDYNEQQEKNNPPAHITPRAGIQIFHYDEEQEEKNNTLVSSFGPGGALYERFDLVLPKNCSIKKSNENEILIETDKLKLFIKTNFQGMNTFLPPEFTKNYLNLDMGLIKTETRAYLICVDILIEMKLITLFSQRGWEYYEWVDSFVEDLDEYLSKDTFFETINWETVRTILVCNEQKQNIVFDPPQ
jgi:hypothetical protein